MVFSLFSEKKSEWSPPTWDLHSWFQPDAHAGRKNNYFDFSACMDCFFRDKTVVPEDGMPYEITKLKKKRQVHQPSATNPPNTNITLVSEVADVEPSAVLGSGTCFFEGDEEEVYAEERATGDFQYDSEDESATVIARPAMEIRNYYHDYEADDCCAEVGDEDDGRGVLLTLLNKEEGIDNLLLLPLGAGEVIFSLWM